MFPKPDVVYGRGGKNKGKKRIVCDVCDSQRYVPPKKLDSSYVGYICGACQINKLKQPPYEAYVVRVLVEIEDPWRPAWYGYKFVPHGTIDDFFADSIGWENMSSVERAKWLADTAGRAVEQDR